MPEIVGQNFPEYEHTEYPKVLYSNGDLKAEALTVGNASEEESAKANGFSYVETKPAHDPVADAPEAEAEPEGQAGEAGEGAGALEGAGEPA